MIRTWRIFETLMKREQEIVDWTILSIYTAVVFSIGMAVGYAIK